ncbi:MAG TPA: PIN domain-containing protein [Candidatus Kapabacteria bacterium]|nr:PIN domain-containing protein [Candidatus Kapabacteria bacterium]
MNYVLDANSSIAFFDGEGGGIAISDLLLTPRAILSLHAINACEVYYHFERKNGVEVANRVLTDILSYGIEIVDEIDPKTWKEAAHLKARYKRLFLADAIGVAYAKKIRGVFVTSDHSELQPLASDNVCKFFFFR